MLFKLKVAPKSDPSKKENKELLFVRHYCPSADEEPERDLSLRHLEWEHIDCRQGKRRKQQAHFAVVECSLCCKELAFAHIFVSGMKGSSTTSW